MSNYKTKTEDLDLAIKNAFQELISRGYKPNFLFIGSSVLHIATLNALLFKIASKGEKLCGVVCDNIPFSRVSQFSNSDIFAVEQDHIIVLRQGCDFVSRESNSLVWLKECLLPRFPGCSLKKFYKEFIDKHYFYLLVTNEEYPPLNLWRCVSTQNLPIKCILLEEGTGTYVSRWSTYHFSAKKESSMMKFLLKLSKSVLIHPLKRNYRLCVERNCNLDTFGLFDTVDGSLSVNKDYCFWINKSLKRQGEIRGFAGKDFSQKVIIVGANFLELGSARLEQLLIEKLITIIKDCGFVPYFRPHPRIKDRSHYAFLSDEIDTNEHCPLEAIIASAQFPPLAVVGFASSSQLMASVLWDIPAITIGSLLKEIAIEDNSYTHTIRAFTKRIELFNETYEEWLSPAADDRDLKNKLVSLR